MTLCNYKKIIRQPLSPMIKIKEYRVIVDSIIGSEDVFYVQLLRVFISKLLNS